MNQNIKYSIFFLLGIIMYYLLFNEKIVEGLETSTFSCSGTVEEGRFEGKPCRIGYETVSREGDLSKGKLWCNVVPGCTLEKVSMLNINSQFSCSGTVGPGSSHSGKDCNEAFNSIVNESDLSNGMTWCAGDWNSGCELKGDIACKGKVNIGRFKEQDCRDAHSTIKSEEGMDKANSWCVAVSGCTLGEPEQEPEPEVNINNVNQISCSGTVGPGSAHSGKTCEEAFNIVNKESDLESAVKWCGARWNTGCKIVGETGCSGIVNNGRFEGQECRDAHSTIIEEQGKEKADSWCVQIPGCTLGEPLPAEDLADGAPIETTMVNSNVMADGNSMVNGSGVPNVSNMSNMNNSMVNGSGVANVSNMGNMNNSMVNGSGKGMGNMNTNRRNGNGNGRSNMNSNMRNANGNGKSNMNSNMRNANGNGKGNISPPPPPNNTNMSNSMRNGNGNGRSNMNNGMRNGNGNANMSNSMRNANGNGKGKGNIPPPPAPNTNTNTNTMPPPPPTEPLVSSNSTLPNSQPPVTQGGNTSNPLDRVTVAPGIVVNIQR